MKKILSLIFVVLLLVPAVTGLIDPDFDIPKNRIGLKAPQMYTRALFDNGYYQAFDHYYNDSFPLRDALVYAKRWVDFHIFGMTDFPAVHVGNEGWLYTRRSIEDLRKEACGTEDDAAKIALELYALEKIIQTSGRRFFFLVAPNKSTIYPEFAGYVPQRQVCNRSRYDLLVEAVSGLPLGNFVRLDPLLKAAKSGHALLYDKTSVYWNGMGAMVAAEAIQRKLAEDSKQEVVMAYTPEAGINSDDLKRQLMGIKPTNADRSIRHFSGTGQSIHPFGIVYGGNCIQKMRPYLQQIFNRLDVIRADRLPSRRLGEDLRRYDVIFLASIESELDALEIDIGGLLAIFEKDGPIADRYSLGLQSAKAISDISLNMDLAVLEIKSVGSASVFELQSLPASDENIFRLLKLSVEAPHPDTMTIRYLTDQPFDVIKVLKKQVTPIYLPLPVQKMASIQIRPGHQPGVFLLRSAEIIEFSRNHDQEDQRQTWLIVADTNLEDDIPPPPAAPESDSEAERINTELHPLAPLATSEMPVLENDEPSENNDASNLFGNPADGKATKPAISAPDHSQTNYTTEISVNGPDRGIDETKSLPARPTTLQSAAPTPVSIAVTDFPDGRIFQRTGRGSDIVVSGTYSGTPGAIEARVVKDGTQDEVVAWTVIDASPQNGIYVGVIPGVPQGGWYNIQVRSTANRFVLKGGTNKWGVGILVACLGQSNMREWFYTGADLMSHPLLRKYNAKGWSELGRQGNAAIAFGNRISERLGVPVGLLDFSVNGSGLRKEANWGTGYWEDTSRHSIYSQFVAGVSETGGKVEFVIWIQGEADAARGTVTEEEYRASLASFISKQVRVDIENGSHLPHLPFLVVAMVKRPGGKDDPHQAIRNAQYRVTETVPESYLAATTLDLKNQGRQHLSNRAYLTMGYRVAQTVFFILNEENYHRGPSIAGARQIDSRTIEVSIEHRGGTDFIPAADITGWEVLANDMSLPLTRVFRHNPHTILIELAQPVAQKTLIRYLYGAMPDVLRPVVDNSAMSLPLEEGKAKVK